MPGVFVFPLMLPGPYSVVASHLGYEVWQDTIYVDATETNSISIELTPTTLALEPVVVDAANQSALAPSLNRVSADPASLQEIIPFSGAVNSLQNLQQKQGIQFNHSSSDIHIQGGAPGEHQVRLDGSPIFLPQQLAGFWGPFNAQAIEHITIHKSGFGARQGSYQSGVIDINHRLTPSGRAICH